MLPKDEDLDAGTAYQGTEFSLKCYILMHKTTLEDMGINIKIS